MITFLAIIFTSLASIRISIMLDNYLETLDTDEYLKTPSYILIIPYFNVIYYLIFITIIKIENKIN